MKSILMIAISALASAAVAQSAGTLTIQTDQGQPIQGAQVTAAGTTATTDQQGHANFPQKSDLSQVTIEAPGFVMATYIGLTPQTQTLKIRAVPQTVTGAQRVELQGSTSGYGDLEDDGTFDLGLMIQAVPRAQLSTLSLQSLISPETDRTSVLGQDIDLPSNIAIPDQTESYNWIPLEFNKPTYRLFEPSQGAYQVASLHAQVPFKDTIGVLQSGKSMIDIINTFSFKSASITPVTLNGATTTQDLTVDGQAFDQQIQFTAPQFDPGQQLLVISLANSNNAFYPTDIKNAAPGATVQLVAPQGASANGMILAAFKKSGTKSVGAQADQYSAVLLPNGAGRPFDPIRLVNAPVVQGQTLNLDAPAAPAGLAPVMTYGTLSVVTLVTNGKLKMETKQALWDVWAPNWVNKIDLPSNQTPSLGPNQSLRWEVGFSAQFTGTHDHAEPGPEALEKITHVTRSAVDL